MKFAPISDRLAGLGAAKWAVHAEGLRRASLGEPIIMLSIGEPDLPPPASVLDAAATAMRSGRTRYAHGQGEPQTLAAIANHLTQRSGVAVSPEQILYTAGTQNGLCTALLTLVQAGDEVLVPDPYYATYEGLVAASGATFVPVATRPEDNFHVTAQAIERAVTKRTKVLLLNTPSNPTGALDDMEAVVKWGRANDVPVFSDECYVEFTWQGKPTTALQYGTQGVIALHSLSKRSNLAGLRVAFYAGDADIVHYLKEVRKHAGLMVPGPAQAAGVVALNDDDSVKVQADIYRRRLERTATVLSKWSGRNIELPAGGFYLWFDATDGWEFAERLATEGGALVSPGDFYGAGGSNNVRVAVVQPDARIELMAQRLGVA